MPSPLVPRPSPRFPLPSPPPSTPLPPTTPTSPLPKRLPAPAALPSASAAFVPEFQPALAVPLFSGNDASGGAGSTGFSLISSLVLPVGGSGLVSSAGLDRSFGAVVFFGLGAGGGGGGATSTFFASSSLGTSISSIGTVTGLIGFACMIKAAMGISPRWISDEAVNDETSQRSFIFSVPWV